MKTKDWLIGLFALALVGTFAYLWMSPQGMTRAPIFAFTTLQGERVDLQSLQGRPVLVTFWATTCPGCVKEMPHLVELYQELGPKGLEIIGVAMPYDPPNQVINLVEQRALPYKIALDPMGEATAAFGNVRLTPTSFLIAPDGRIVTQRIGEMDMQALHAQIVALLG